MTSTTDGGRARPRRRRPRSLPAGLRICETCGEARGTTPRGSVSACYCSGLLCTACGERRRLPISDYYDWRARSWSHVSFISGFSLGGGHRCPVGPGEEPRRTPWTKLPRDPDVIAYQRAVTEFTMRWVRERPAGREREQRPADDGPEDR